MAKHTPGPWAIEDQGHLGISIHPAGRVATELDATCQVDCGAWDCGIKEGRANARLIAAAPDLLKACTAFVIAWDKSHQLEKTDAAMLLARAAIERATT